MSFDTWPLHTLINVAQGGPWRLHWSDEWCSSQGSIGWQPGAQPRENGAPYLKHEGMRADDLEASF